MTDTVIVIGLVLLYLAITERACMLWRERREKPDQTCARRCPTCQQEIR